MLSWSLASLGWGYMVLLFLVSVQERIYLWCRPLLHLHHDTHTITVTFVPDVRDAGNNALICQLSDMLHKVSLQNYPWLLMPSVTGYLNAVELCEGHILRASYVSDLVRLVRQLTDYNLRFAASRLP